MIDSRCDLTRNRMALPMGVERRQCCLQTFGKQPPGTEGSGTPNECQHAACLLSRSLYPRTFLIGLVLAWMFCELAAAQPDFFVTNTNDDGSAGSLRMVINR